jgi:hypothetical protein
MNDMVKMTVYFSEPLKAQVSRVAREQNRSQAAVMRDARTVPPRTV